MSIRKQKGGRLPHTELRTKRRKPIEENAEYRAAHKPEAAECQMGYRAAHKPEAAEYRATHREEAAEYRATHKEEKTEYSAAHKEEIARKASPKRGADRIERRGTGLSAKPFI